MIVFTGPKATETAVEAKRLYVLPAPELVVPYDLLRDAVPHATTVIVCSDPQAAKRLSGHLRVPVVHVNGDGDLDALESLGWRRRARTLYVGVFGNKGGCGKTLIATSLAAALAQREASVLLVDGDLTDENIGLIYADPEPSLFSLVREVGEGTFGIEALHRHTQPMKHVPAVTVLTAGSGNDNEWRKVQRLSVAQAVLRAAEGAFDYVIVDLPAESRFVSPFGAALAYEFASAFVVVAAAGVAEIIGADRSLHLLRQAGVVERALLVLNMISRETPHELVERAERVAQSYDVTLAAKIPRVSTLAKRAELAGVPLYAFKDERRFGRSPLAGFRNEIERIVEAVTTRREALVA